MFCRNCGKEVDDNAYVCTGCGCLVNEGKARRKEVVEGQSKKEKIATILLMVSFGLFCYFLFLRFFSVYNLFGVIDSSKEVEMYNFLVNTQNIIAWIVSCLALSVAVFALIFGLKEKSSLKILLILNFMLALSIGLAYTCNMLLDFMSSIL